MQVLRARRPIGDGAEISLEGVAAVFSLSGTLTPNSLQEASEECVARSTRGLSEVLNGNAFPILHYIMDTCRGEIFTGKRH